MKGIEITVVITKKMKEKMKKYDEINWSALIRKTIDEKIKKLDTIEQMMEKEKEIIDWSVSLQKKSRKGRAEELRKEGLIGSNTLGKKILKEVKKEIKYK